MYCKGKGADFYFIQETHACSSDEFFGKNQWGTDMWFSNGSNKSAGAGILKDKFSGQILHFEKDIQVRCIILVVVTNYSYFILINIYATNKKSSNLLLFQDIESRASHLFSVYPVSKVIWGGDFNTVLDEYADRLPPKNITTSCELQHLCLRMGLLDI